MVAGLSCTTTPLHGQIYVIEVKFHGLQIRVTPDSATAPALTRFSILSQDGPSTENFPVTDTADIPNRTH